MARRASKVGATTFCVSRFSVWGNEADGSPARPVSFGVTRPTDHVSAAVRMLDGDASSLLMIGISTRAYHAQLAITGGGPAVGYVVQVSYGLVGMPVAAGWTVRLARPRRSTYGQMASMRRALGVSLSGAVRSCSPGEVVGLRTALAAARYWAEKGRRAKGLRWKPDIFMRGRAKELATQFP